MVYRNMVRDRVQQDFIKDAVQPGIMHDTPPLDDKMRKKKKKKSPMKGELGKKNPNAPTESLLDL